MSECRSGAVGLDAEMQLCLVELAATNSDATLMRVGSSWTRFGEFAARHDVQGLGQVAPTLAASFVRSRTSADSPAGTATMHNRRTALRLLFRTARRLGLIDGDPTLDLVLPPRAVGSFRPLSDDEIELCRDAAAWWMTSQRFAAVWALAESSARGAELGSVRAVDVDLADGCVWLSGGKRVEPRWAPLTEWARDALERRLSTLGEDEFVAYRGTSPGAGSRISAASAVTAVLTRAGLAGEPDLRPTSVAAWTGRKEFDRTGSIADAARLLGLRSLDAAARMIGWNWTT
jgi:integrase